MQTDSNHKHWGAADFARYYSGNMPAAEMHALEKAALEDPFLQDALEGYQLSSSPVKEIESIKQQLWPAHNTTPVVPIAWYKTRLAYQLYKAASIVLIAGGIGWFLVNKTFTDTNSADANIAANKPAVADSFHKQINNLTDTSPTVAKLDEASVEKITNTANSPASTNTSAQAPDKKNTALTDTQKEVQHQISEANGAPSSTAGVPELSKASEKVMSREQAAPVTAPAANNNLLRGRVINSQGQPIAHAQLSNRLNDKQQTSTDENGYFVMQDVAANNNDVPLQVNASGYDELTKTVAINSPQNTIVLNQVQQQASARTNSKKQNYQWNGRNSLIQLRNASPLDGWDYFYYLMNDSLSQNPILKNHRGKIILQFTTNDTGRVEQVSVKKSLHAQADSVSKAIFLHSPVLQLNNKQKMGEAIIKLP